MSLPRISFRLATYPGRAGSGPRPGARDAVQLEQGGLQLARLDLLEVRHAGSFRVGGTGGSISLTPSLQNRTRSDAEMAYLVPDLPYPPKRSSLISTPRRCGSTTTSTTRPTSTTRTRRWTAPKWADRFLEDILRDLILPADKQGPVRNNAGGHANHSLFWTVMSPTAAASRAATSCGDRRLRRLRTSSRRPGSRASAVDGGVARLGRLGRRDHVDGESGQPAERRQGSSSAPTSGNTPTTCATRTAARTTSPPGGTSSPGTRWRADAGGARLSRTR